MEADEDNDTFSLLEQQRRKTSSAAASHFAVYVAFLFPALAGFLFGFDIGATSGAVESLLGALDGDLRHSSHHMRPADRCGHSSWARAHLHVA